MEVNRTALEGRILAEVDTGTTTMKARIEEAGYGWESDSKDEVVVSLAKGRRGCSAKVTD